MSTHFRYISEIFRKNYKINPDMISKICQLEYPIKKNFPSGLIKFYIFYYFTLYAYLRPAVDSQGHKLFPWTGTFTGSKLLFFQNFNFFTLDFCFLETETQLTDGCKRISSSSRFEWYRPRPLARYGRLRRTDPRYNTSHKKQIQRFDFKQVWNWA